MKSALLFLVSIAASAQVQQYFLAPNPVTLGPVGTAQPFVCHTTTCAGNQTGAEILYTQTVGVGTCFRFWSQSINGALQTNLSSAYFIGGSQLPDPTLYNASGPRYSPDGAWIIVVAQDTHTSLACTAPLAKPGAGFGYGLFVCRVATNVCYEMAIEGDNTGNFCAAGAACPVMASLVNYVDDFHGVLHWYFTPDQTKIFGMYVMGRGASGPTQEGINGTLRWATITLPGSGAPTLSNVTETDVPPLGDGTGTFNWYEGAGALPVSIESSTCTIFATSINNSDGLPNHTSILQYNICLSNSTSGVFAYLPPSTAYQEFWNIRPQGDLGIGIDAQYLPASLPFCLCGNIAGPTDLTLGPPTVGKTTQLTFFNNNSPKGNPVTIMSETVWDWTGKYVIASKVLANNTTHVASSSSILKFTLMNIPGSFATGTLLAGSVMQ